MRRNEATAEPLRGGWLHTGDIGAFDEDGYLTLRDRSKDLIISGGMNIYPREVEEALLHHPEVQAVKNEFIWLEYNQKSTVVIKRTDLPEMWASLMPEVTAFEQASVNQQFPPKKNGLCREWCPVTSCEFNGKYRG